MGRCGLTDEEGEEAEGEGIEEIAGHDLLHSDEVPPVVIT